MAYERMGLKDFDESNPFAAKHVDHLEDGIVQNESDIAQVNADLTDMDILDIGTLINEGDDLDDYNTPGRYTSNSTDISASLSNCPISSATFALIVLKLGTAGNGRFMQIILRNASSSTVIYFRNKTSNIWSATWYQLTGTSVSTTSIGDPVVMGDEDSVED